MDCLLNAGPFILLTWLLLLFVLLSFNPPVILDVTYFLSQSLLIPLNKFCSKIMWFDLSSLCMDT